MISFYVIYFFIYAVTNFLVESPKKTRRNILVSKSHTQASAFKVFRISVNISRVPFSPMLFRLHCSCRAPLLLMVRALERVWQQFSIYTYYWTGKLTRHPNKYVIHISFNVTECCNRVHKHCQPLNSFDFWSVSFSFRWVCVCVRESFFHSLFLFLLLFSFIFHIFINSIVIFVSHHNFQRTKACFQIHVSEIRVFFHSSGLHII